MAGKSIGENLKKTIHEEIGEMLQDFPAADLIALLRNMVPLWQLFDVDDESDWVANIVGEEDESNVRMIRALFLVSKLSDACSGMLCRISFKHKGFWKRLEAFREELKAEEIKQAGEQYLNNVKEAM